MQPPGCAFMLVEANPERLIPELQKLEKQHHGNKEKPDYNKRDFLDEGWVEWEQQVRTQDAA